MKMMISMSKLTHKFSPEKQDLIIQTLRGGNYRACAAKVAGISEKTLSFWMNSKDKKYQQFQKKVLETEAEVEAFAVRKIIESGEKDARWYAWWLERKFKRWNQSVHRWEIQVLQKQLKDLKNVVNSLSEAEQTVEPVEEEGPEPPDR